MAYIALYRKWRPSVFEDVVEQEHVVKTLRYSVSTQRIAHAYLFCGTRGTGKTTMAHILSRAINCLSPRDGDPCNECEICRGILSGSILDVLEIDAASNNSVDNIREIRDEVIYAPSQAKYKVYIIDEVHMLSSGAFNALLKTLEEPPAHVVFILATTEPHKLPATILSRCQRFDFRRITVESIMKRLEDIASSNEVAVHKDALRLIARMADGALRDAISLLDQCISLGNREISYNDVLSVVGIVNDTFIADMAAALGSRDIIRILDLVERLVMDGKDIMQFVGDLVLYYRNLLICKVTDKPEEIVNGSREVIEIMKKQCIAFDQEKIIYIIKELSSLESSLKWATHPRILLEVTLVRICEDDVSLSNSSIPDRLSALERKMSSGNFTPAPAANPNITENVASAAPVEKVKKAPPAVPVERTGKTAVQSKTGLEIWSQVLGELKSSGRMALYTYLMDTRAVELDDKFVGIVFGPGKAFNKMIVSKAENAEILEEAVSKKLGRETRIRCVDEESLIESAPAAAGEEKDEAVEKARDIAKKLNVPFNVIDE